MSEAAGAGRKAPRLGRVLALLCLLALVRAGMARFAPGLGFSDDLMRLVEVQDWLAGQGWFDMVQHRMLPPDGVSMHWSRYVDVGIAAVLLPLGWLVHQPEAEMLAMILWPTLLLCGLIWITGSGAARLWGAFDPHQALAAALGAGLVAMFWAKLGAGKFGPGALDHHNVQLLLTTLALGLLVVPGPRAVWRGVGAGLALAGSLAVGLEMLPLVALIWAMGWARLVLGRAGARSWLGGLSAAMAIGAPLLMVGQVPVSEWSVMRCDELAPPVLAMVAAGVASSLVGVALVGRLRSPLVLLAAMVAVAAVGLTLAAPLAGPCLAGPYGEMPDEARRIIGEDIAEALPVWTAFVERPGGVNALITPALAVVLLAGTLGWRLRNPQEREALLLLLVPAIAGLGLALVQIRALAVAAPAIPFLAGFVLARIVALYGQGQRRGAALVAMLSLVTVGLPQLPLAAAQGLIADEAQTQPGAAERACRSQQAVAEMTGLPAETVLFSELNVGPMILANTPYSATSGAYHRSAAAFWNGVVPFRRETAMVAALHDSGADYLVLCRAAGGSGTFGARLLAGDLPPWLKPTSGMQEKVLLLQVDKPALAAAWLVNPPETMAGGLAK